MKDIMIYSAWIGAGCMGVGLSKEQAIAAATAEGRNTGLWGPDGLERGSFETEEEFVEALDIGEDWLSECSRDVLFLLDTREVPE